MEKIPYRFLIPDKKYRVVKEFRDYDSAAHPEGEEWIYQSYNFVPYHDGLSLFVRINGKEEQIRLQTTPEEQLHITENLGGYLKEIF